MVSDALISISTGTYCGGSRELHGDSCWGEEEVIVGFRGVESKE